MMTRRRAQSSQTAQPLPDELWALVLSKCSWEGAWEEVLPLLLWRPGAGAALRGRPDQLAELLHGQREGAEPLAKAATEGQAGVVRCLLQLDGIIAGKEGGHDGLGAAATCTAQIPAHSRYLRPVPVARGRDCCEVQLAIVKAARHGHAAVVTQLVPCCHGSRRTAACVQARWEAASAGSMAVVGQLLALDMFAEGPFSCLCASSSNGQRAQWMGRDADLSYLALKVAASAGCADAARQLLADLPATAPDWYEMAEMAAACNRSGVVQALLQHSKGAPASVVERLLRVPAIRGNAAMVQLLMDGSVRTRSGTRCFQAVLQ